MSNPSAKTELDHIREQLTQAQALIAIALDRLDNIAATPVRLATAVSGEFPAAICSLVTSYYHIPTYDFWSSTRHIPVVQARMVAMFLLRQQTRLSSTRIGELFGKDHGTVLHAQKRISDLLTIDPRLRQDIALLTPKVQALASTHAATHAVGAPGDNQTEAA